MNTSPARTHGAALAVTHVVSHAATFPAHDAQPHARTTPSRPGAGPAISGTQPVRPASRSNSSGGNSTTK